MPHTISRHAGVLVEDRIRVLAPVTRIHGVVAHKLELSETIVAVVGTCGAVDHELLASLRIRELLWAFIGGQTIVASTAKGSLFPCILGYGDDLSLRKRGCDRVWIRKLGDAEISWPTIVLAVPARVDVVQLVFVLKIGPINSELVVSIKLALVLKVGSP